MDDVKSGILAALNPEQQAAVQAGGQRTLILAGAGVGKTRVLTHRIAWLLAVDQVSPSSVLAVTFTNKAAREMRDRLSRMITPSVNDLSVGTFHGIAHRWLRTHHEASGLPRDFPILDGDDQERLIRRLIKDAGGDPKMIKPSEVSACIGRWKDDGRRVRDLDSSDLDPFERQAFEIYGAYEDACLRGGLVDFGEMLLRCLETWRRYPETLTLQHQVWTDILVDEFQDTNRVQYEWIRALAGPSGRVFVVGDDDQSIYGWRGAKVRHMQDFLRESPDAMLLRLERNYRSTPNILDAANALISANPGRIGKRLWTEGERGACIHRIIARDEQDEATRVVELFKESLDAGRPLNEHAILYRTHALSRSFEEALLRAGIPFRIHGGLRFFERSEVKDAIAWLRCVVNPDDDLAVERIANIPTRGLGEDAMAEMRAMARQSGRSLVATAANVSLGGISPRRAAAWQTFLDLRSRLATTEPDPARPGSLMDFVREVMEESGLRAMHARSKREEAEARLENLDELLGIADRFQVEYSPAAGSMGLLRDFLAQTALDAGDLRAAPGAAAVQMMTLHAAKGLEFGMVALVGMEDRVLPSARALNDPAALEEERRLAYVGVTRARHDLIIASTQFRRLYGTSSAMAPSRFIADIPSELMSDARPPSIPILRPGHRVMSPDLGPGVVAEVEGTGHRQRVLVLFKAHGAQWLLAAEAGLRRT